jgi:putative lipoic acid-binding regulatory protein
MGTLDKLSSLLNQVEQKIDSSSHHNSLGIDLRKENLKFLEVLYNKLEISKKHDNFKSIFEYKAMNLSGIGLKKEDFAEIREGKYIQIISIAYQLNEKGKRIAKNSSLGYFGKAERLEPELKKNIIEFVLRWRYEKAFQHTEHYELLLKELH